MSDVRGGACDAVSVSLLTWLWRLFDRRHIDYGPPLEEPPRPVTRLRPRRMDEPRRRDEGGLSWDDDD